MVESEIPKEEGVQVEFELRWSENALRTLTAFANTYGGSIWFGVDDGGRVLGIDGNGNDLISDVVYACRAGIEPAMHDLVECRIGTLNGKRIVEARVMPGARRPYGLRGRRLNGGTFVRDGNSSVVASEEELLKLIREGNPTPWEKRIAHETEVTFNGLESVFKKHGLVFSDELCDALNLKTSYGLVTNLGLLLSDQNQRSIKVTWHAGEKPQCSSLTGGLLHQVERVFYNFDLINPRYVVKTKSLASKSSWAWPPQALSAALLNCLVHRDWTVGRETEVDIRDGRISIRSFGAAVGSMAMDDVLKLESDKCRNPGLAAIFKRLGWLEEGETCASAIAKGYGESTIKPDICSTLRSFVITLPRFARKWDSRLCMHDRVALLFERFGQWTAADIGRELGISRTSVNTVLKELLDEGRIEKTGGGRSTGYVRL